MLYYYFSLFIIYQIAHLGGGGNLQNKKREILIFLKKYIETKYIAR